MPIALELFDALDQPPLLDDCWAPFSWDENGIVVLVDDPSDMGNQAIIKSALKTEWVIFTGQNLN